jgi:hypothetical protein
MLRSKLVVKSQMSGEFLALDHLADFSSQRNSGSHMQHKGDYIGEMWRLQKWDHALRALLRAP